jgi:hypothetical protein
MEGYNQRSTAMLHLQQTTASNIRVGEAFTKDRKSSALSSEGLTDMVHRARDRTRGRAATAWMCAGLRCSMVARMGWALSIGLVAEVSRAAGWGWKRGRRQALGGCSANGGGETAAIGW